MAAFAGLLAVGVLLFPPHGEPGFFIGYVAALIVLLIAVCWLTGEPPRWRWGNDDGAAPKWVSDAARARGPISRDCYRVVVLESGGELSTKDFEDRALAERYANDAASESDGPAPLAYVFGDKLQLVARGRHYASPDPGRRARK